MTDYFGHNGRQSSATAEYAQPPNKPNPQAPRCRMAWPGSKTGGTSELGCVLRRRLLIASLMPAAGFTLYFVRNLIWPEAFFLSNEWLTVVMGTGAALFIFIATLLGSHLHFNTRHLRVIEILLFGGLAAYFAIIQMAMLYHGNIASWADPESVGNVIRLANASNNLRWFSLIVIYGTFVPNTWKRCAGFVGLWVAIPLVLSLFVCAKCPIMGPHVLQSLLDTVTVLGIASAIAIFGSYKISELHQEAMEAKRLGQYQLKEKIGSGGMGEVYLGEHVMLRRACAIKLIRGDQNDNITVMSRFEREVKAMATLTHWNTVEVYDYGLSEDGTFYYVMEYLPGMSLQELVEQHGPLQPARAIHLLRQICNGLREAHSTGLIHRDIKPSNVLITERGGIHDVAKILDFGLVQSVGLQDDMRLTMQGTVLGSPPYMSPEQAQGKDKLDPLTDIYSLGGLAYFLLTGHPPFERETPMQILMAHVYDIAAPPSELYPEMPEDLEQVILKCLKKDPKLRYQSVDELEQALAECDSANLWHREDAAAWWRENKESPARDVAGVV